MRQACADVAAVPAEARQRVLQLLSLTALSVVLPSVISTLYGMRVNGFALAVRERSK